MYKSNECNHFTNISRICVESDRYCWTYNLPLSERTLVHANDDMHEERLDEDEDEMEEDGTTSVSEMGTSLPGDLDIGLNIAGLGKSFGAELQRNLLVSSIELNKIYCHLSSIIPALSTLWNIKLDQMDAVVISCYRIIVWVIK